MVIVSCLTLRVKAIDDIFTKIYISGDTSIVITDKLRFDEISIRGIIERIIKKERTDGYLYAQLSLDSLMENKKIVELYLSNRLGPKLKIENLIYKGLKRTDKNIISKIINIKQYDYLNPYILKAIELKASYIPFLKFYPPVKVSAREGYTSFDAILNFSEKKAVYFEGGGGYVPDSDSKYFYNLKLKFNNLFGQGKQVEILSIQPDDSRKELKIGYQQPLFLFGAGYYSANVAIRDFRSEFYEFNLSTGYRFEINHNINTNFSISWKNVEIDLGELSYNSYNLTFGIEKGYLLENLSAPFLYSNWNITFGYRKYDTAPENQTPGFNETRVCIENHLKFKLLGQIYSSVKIRYFGLETNESMPPLSEKYFIGGNNYLRGYRNDQFAVIRTAILNLEPGLQFSSFKAFIFYDYAFLNDRFTNQAQQIETEDSFKSGYGLGVQLFDSEKDVKISVGWNQDISFNQARLILEFSSEI